ncbi:MAG: DUF4397 domain-containing protein [Polyangia bacterium]|jgi:hypothetical protein
MLRVRLTASGIGLAATLSVLISSGCTPAPTEIVAVDSGVNVMPDMVVPITTAQLRFGNFVAGAAPVDLCIKAQGESSFTGPILRTLAQRTGGVSYLNMGQYVTLTAGSYTVRAVPGTRTDCAVAYGGLPDLGLPTIGAGRSYTLVPFGDQTRIGTVKLNLFEDDLTPQGGQVRLRFINASPDVPTADFGFGTGTGYKALLTDAVSGDLGRSSGMTYVSTAPQTAGAASVKPTAMTSDLITVNSNVNIPSGAVMTMLIAGLPSRTGTDPLALKLISCDDSKAPQSGLSVCTQLN